MVTLLLLHLMSNMQTIYGNHDNNNQILNHIFVRFSHDRGNCFKSEKIDLSEHFKLSKGLLMDPATASLYAFALGLEGNNDNDPWRLIAINFGSILGSPC